MQISIVNGIYTDGDGEFRTSLPRNRMVVPKSQGISSGYLRPADGVTQYASGPGVCRGTINWLGSLYAVMGTKLVLIDLAGVVSVIGDVGNDGKPVSFDYSFDRLAIASNGNLFYYVGGVLKQVTDVDLKTVVDMLWVDGYFMTTDGTSLVVTELNDPMAISPLKYGSSEVNPDKVLALLKLRNEVYALNRNTIEIFQNIGGPVFPFQRVPGALIERGVVGTHACTVFDDSVAFLGSKLREAPSIYLAANGTSVSIADREIDTILQGYTEAQLSTVVLESKINKKQLLLYVHLPDKTLVYDAAASKQLATPVWVTLTSSLVDTGMYRARFMCWVYDKWLAGDPTSSSIGSLVGNISSHYGNRVGWQFDTPITYNAGRGLIFHDMELVCLTGRAILGDDPVVWTSYTIDGTTYGQEHPVSAGKLGEREKRISWRRQGNMKQFRIQRFRGNSDAHISVARLEAQIEPLVN